MGVGQRGLRSLFPVRTGDVAPDIEAGVSDVMPGVGPSIGRWPITDGALDRAPGAAPGGEGTLGGVGTPGRMAGELKAGADTSGVVTPGAGTPGAVTPGAITRGGIGCGG